MPLVIARNWKTFALRGVVGLAFGMMAIFAPTRALIALVILLGGYCVLDGVFALAMAWSIERHRALLALEGGLSLLLGAAILFQPNTAAKFILYLMAGWAIVTGIVEYLIAWRIRHLFPQVAIVLPLAAAASILLGITVIVWPLPSAAYLMVVFGCYAIFSGTATLIAALRLRAQEGQPTASRKLHVVF